ncbi:MAG: hypothetical protein ACODAU_01940 [Myxococcota bacterium]
MHPAAASAVAGVLLLAFAGGCADADLAPPPRVDATLPDGAAPEGNTLQVRSDQPVTLAPEASTEIELLLTGPDGTPVADEAMELSVQGESGATLAADEAVTGSDGVARVGLVAGEGLEAFLVQVSAPAAATVRVPVSVGDRGFVDLEVVGDDRVVGREVDGWMAQLFVGRRCEEEPWREAEPGRSVAIEPNGPVPFPALPVGLPAAVAVLAEGTNAEPVGVGCGQVTIPAEGPINLMVSAFALPLELSGTFDLTLRLDAEGVADALANELREAATGFAGGPGAESGNLLDAIEREVRARDPDLGAIFAQRRETFDLDRELQTSLDREERGIDAVVGSVTERIRSTLGLLEVRGPLTVRPGADDPFDLAVDRVDAIDPRTGDVVSSTPASAFGAGSETFFEGTPLPSRDELQLTRLEVDVPAGTVAADLLELGTVTGGTAELAARLAEPLGCPIAAELLAGEPLLFDACPEECALAACRRVADGIARDVLAETRALDGRLQRVRVDTGTITRIPVDDDDGDLRVDAFEVGGLRGTFGSIEGESTDVPLSVTIHGSRR